jgi:2-polyprenyl-3-methyl-5-hydroxy-6-metoxy-1,4-benzoquinol methylase
MLRDRRNRREVYSRADFWNAKASELKGDAVSMWRNNHLNRLYHADQLALLDAELPELAGRDVLDLGCGTGRISRHLASRGARVVGVDFAEKAVAIARSLSTGGNPRYEVGSMFELEGEARYDAIVSWGSVAIACRDAAGLAQVAARLHQLLRPSGKLLLLEPVHRGFLHRVLDMDVAEFSHVLERAGFRGLRVREMHFWPVRLALAYVPWPRWITVPMHEVGEFFLSACGDGWGGDYKAVMAARV